MYSNSMLQDRNTVQRAAAAADHHHPGGAAVVRAQMHRNDHGANRRGGSDVLEEEDETESVEEGEGEGGGGGGGVEPSGTPSRRLPPLSAPPGPRATPQGNNPGLPPRRARSSRKQRREQVGLV